MRQSCGKVIKKKGTKLSELPPNSNDLIKSKFFSFHCCPTSCMCCLHCSSRRFSDGSYLGFLFCFCCFFYVAFRKHICFDSEGVTRDRLVFGMLKHGHVSFQILTRYFWQFGFWDQTPDKHTLDCFFIPFFIFY